MKGTPPALDDAVFRPLGEAEGPALQRLLERCADFEVLMRGSPPAAEAAQELLEACPAGHPLQKKLVFGLERDGELIGALDLLRDYPETDDWYLGLLLFEPQSRSGGLGERVVAALRGWIADQGGRAIRLAVHDINEDGARFWVKMGFQPCGTAVQERDGRTEPVTRMELRL
ncbi:MAG: GNAT family N-acetyltransferase [Phenylobacterium sp.]